MAATLLVIITLWTLTGTAVALLIGQIIVCADARRDCLAGAAAGASTDASRSVPAPREPAPVAAPVGADAR